MASVWGEQLKISVFGESHGESIGIVLDGFPCGMKIDFDNISALMARRAPGGKLSTKRREADIPEIQSGVTNGITNGFPICAIIRNTNTRSADYGDAITVPRPNHADYPAMLKYGEFAELHGGGHFSGRLTAPLVFGGALCMQYLEETYGIRIAAHIRRIKDVCDTPFGDFPDEKMLECLKGMEFPALDSAAAKRFEEIIAGCANDGDSVGAEIECAAINVPPAWGEHMFEGMESEISSLMFAIPGVKGIGFGAGFAFADMYGSKANDAYEINDGKVTTLTNNCGGIAGGMTNGMPLVFSLVMKPTPSIFKTQKSIDINKLENTELTIHGRHDPCIALRAVPVVEACTAIALCNAVLKGR